MNVWQQPRMSFKPASDAGTLPKRKPGTAYVAERRSKTNAQKRKPFCIRAAIRSIKRMPSTARIAGRRRLSTSGGSSKPSVSKKHLRKGSLLTQVFIVHTTEIVFIAHTTEIVFIAYITEFLLIAHITEFLFTAHITEIASVCCTCHRPTNT